MNLHRILNNSSKIHAPGVLHVELAVGSLLCFNNAVKNVVRLFFRASPCDPTYSIFYRQKMPKVYRFFRGKRRGKLGSTHFIDSKCLKHTASSGENEEKSGIDPIKIVRVLDGPAGWSMGFHLSSQLLLITVGCLGAVAET